MSYAELILFIAIILLVGLFGPAIQRDWQYLTLTAEEFDELERCMTHPREPIQAIK